MKIWDAALKQISNQDVAIYGPQSFREYLLSNDLPKVNTAPEISIDSFELLRKELKVNNAMVLRLGASEKGTGTRFVLVKVRDSLKDFFIMDDEVLSDKGQPFTAVSRTKELLGYSIMPFLSETSLVNLALTSGIISHALGLDNNAIPAAPTTGKAGFSFKLKAHSKTTEVLSHNKGQVEIDALFVEKRQGKDTLFVIEAKSNSHKSLAKHKLVYPILAVAQKVPSDIPIVPVYLRIVKHKGSYSFHIVECIFPDPRKEITSIDNLKAKKHSNYILKL
ncbi:hypothetical protein PRVXH_001809 [Proteinivorax hydrogeniformans]|uniref:DUF6997 domain-containing protein n=1 Tax=Proteinivorax hydrogeniformans TaxID=1826727 RepID=A0AAU8HQT3_9FIRM